MLDSRDAAGYREGHFGVCSTLVRMIGSTVQAVGEVEVGGATDRPVEDKLGF